MSGGGIKGGMKLARAHISSSRLQSHTSQRDGIGASRRFSVGDSKHSQPSARCRVLEAAPRAVRYTSHTRHGVPSLSVYSLSIAVAAVSPVDQAASPLARSEGQSMRHAQVFPRSADAPLAWRAMSRPAHRCSDRLALSGRPPAFWIRRCQTKDLRIGITVVYSWYENRNITSRRALRVRRCVGTQARRFAEPSCEGGSSRVRRKA